MTWLHKGALRARKWAGKRDADGHRHYQISFLVEGNPTDGPANAMQTPGLPLPGSFWYFRDDIDVWAFCLPALDVTPLKTKGPNRFFEVGMTFTTKNEATGQRCSDVTVEDPLLELPKVSGGSVFYNEEITKDRFGLPISSSSFEQIRGPQVEFPVGYDTVKIEQNVAILNLPFLSAMRNTVNLYAIWGYGYRQVRLANVSWEKKYYGTCYYYYTRTLEFELNYRGFDRLILDEGTKVLNGHWDVTTGNWVLDDIGLLSPDPSNPNHFMKAIDRQGNPMKVILNGLGMPADVVVGTGGGEVTSPGHIPVAYYPDADYYLLGIPTIL